jgi:hypothetical protein
MNTWRWVLFLVEFSLLLSGCSSVENFGVVPTIAMQRPDLISGKYHNRQKNLESGPRPGATLYFLLGGPPPVRDDSVTSVEIDASSERILVRAFSGSTCVGTRDLLAGKDYKFVSGEGILIKDESNSGNGIGHSMPGYSWGSAKGFLTLTTTGDIAYKEVLSGRTLAVYVLPTKDVRTIETIYRKMDR